jgi:hypothetical protein
MTDAVVILSEIVAGIFTLGLVVLMLNGSAAWAEKSEVSNQALKPVRRDWLFVAYANAAQLFTSDLRSSHVRLPIQRLVPALWSAR